MSSASGSGSRSIPKLPSAASSVGWQQRVEILKALYREARILVLDEPTAVLTPQETKEIFAVLRRLASDGHSIVFISHKLYEVLEIADRITVIRRGRVVGTTTPAETDEEQLAEMMVGREVQLTVDRGDSTPGDVVLDVKDLVVRNDRGRETVHKVSFEVRGGEILGVAGVAGNGQDDLVEAITGLRSPSGGKVTLERPGRDRQLPAGAARGRRGPRAGRPPALRDGPVVPADRQPGAHRLLPAALREGPGPESSRRSRRPPSGSSRSSTSGRRRATAPASTLSGGNQQKLVVAREFSGDVRLLVLDQPTRGLDVGSIEFIHRQAITKRDAGTAILLVSAELDEVLELSDRIAVMFGGEIVAVVDGRTAVKEDIGLLMATGGRGRDGGRGRPGERAADRPDDAPRGVRRMTDETRPGAPEPESPPPPVVARSAPTRPRWPRA